MRWTVRLLRATAWVVAAIVLAFFVLLWFTLPQPTGERRLAGLAAPVTVLRDADGIPRIRAATEADAYFALGYVHAQDRLFQMDVMRRFGSGRMAEVLGRAGLRLDRVARTMGFRIQAEAQLARIAPETRAAIDAYTAGVNALIAERGWRAAPEFGLLAYRPEPWQPTDSLLWGRLMAMMLSGNYRTELQRLRLLALAPEADVRALWQPGLAIEPDSVAAPAAGPVLRKGALEAPVIDRAALAALGSQAERLLAASYGPGDPVWPTTASNVFAVSGARSATGLPLLASDPHLQFAQPILWYVVRIELPDRVLVGASAPGNPFLVLGQNGRIAWSMTTTHGDTQDLFLERLADGDPGSYLAPSGPMPFRTREEEIVVRFGNPERLRVRETRHGPVISDLDPELGRSLGSGFVMALAAAALAPDDRSPDSLYHLNRAGSVAEAEAALRLMASPQQNVTVADREGHIGMFVPGRAPVRRRGDGFSPVPGWTGDYDWTGFVPVEELPRFVDPPSQQLLHANNRFQPPGRPPFLAADWPPPFRAERIRALLAGAEQHDAAGLARFQMDRLSLVASRFLPTALEAARQPGGQARQALERLSGWDYVMAADRPEPLIFVAWIEAFAELLVGQRLGVEAGGLGEAGIEYALRVLHDEPARCGPGNDACGTLVRQALDRALFAIQERHGRVMANWSWGRAHEARFEHPVFRFVPVLGAVFGSRLASGGGNDTVMRGGFFGSGPDPYASVHGASYRAVYDLGDPDASHFVMATGQSGHLLSRHYRDFLLRWRAGQMVRIGPDPGPHAAEMRLLPVR